MWKDDRGEERRRERTPDWFRFEEKLELDWKGGEEGKRGTGKGRRGGNWGGKRMEEVGRRDYVWGESNREWQETGSL